MSEWMHNSPSQTHMPKIITCRERVTRLSSLFHIPALKQKQIVYPHHGKKVCFSWALGGKTESVQSLFVVCHKEFCIYLHVIFFSFAQSKVNRRPKLCWLCSPLNFIVQLKFSFSGKEMAKKESSLLQWEGTEWACKNLFFSVGVEILSSREDGSFFLIFYIFIPEKLGVLLWSWRCSHGVLVRKCTFF